MPLEIKRFSPQRLTFFNNKVNRFLLYIEKKTDNGLEHALPFKQSYLLSLTPVEIKSKKSSLWITFFRLTERFLNHFHYSFSSLHNSFLGVHSNKKVEFGRFTSMSNKLKFQKYLVLMACFLIMSVSFSIVNNITSLLLDPVTKHLGLSISSFSLIFTIGAVTTALMSPITGHLVSKVPLKLLMAIGSILAGGGFFCYALAKMIGRFI